MTSNISDPFRDIVLLGAGASIEAGFPPAAGLSMHIDATRQKLESLKVTRSVIERIDDDIHWLREVQENLTNLSQQLSGLDPKNIEDIFRIWGHDIQSSSPPPDAPGALIRGYQYPRLVRMMAIALAYSPRFPSLREFDESNVYSWLVSKITRTSGGKSSPAPVVITTNYDLILEFAVANNPNVDLSYTYTKRSGLQHLFGREMIARCTLRYLKLHGSVNWWGPKRGSKVSLDSVRSMVESESPLASVAERYDDAGRDIEMVPPAILKDIIYQSNWNEVWEQAYATFCRCRKLTIVVYSFSPGDILVQQMATLGLARSPFLKSITVIDPNADAVIAILKSYFHDKFISRIEWRGFNERFDDETPRWIPAEIF